MDYRYPFEKEGDLLIETAGNSWVVPTSSREPLRLKADGVDFELYYRPNKDNTNIIPLNLPTQQNLTLTTSWQSHRPVVVDGVSDYSYATVFMPKWSTAYKFPWSTHAKTVEPFFTNLMRFRKDPDSYKTRTPILGTKQHLPKLTNVLYFNDDREILRFDPTEVYILAKEDISIWIEGEYNDAFVFDRVDIKVGVNKLRYNYDKIYNLLFSSEEPVVVCNYIPLVGKLQDARDKPFNIDGANIIGKHVFTLPFSSYDGIYITHDDHVYIRQGNTIYTGKLDLDIGVNIPADPSYNNSEYIEECRIETEQYRLELFLDSYLNYANQEQVAVIISTSDGRVRYLTPSMELSEEKQYIPSTISRNAKSIVLTIDMDADWVLVRLEDFNNTHPISHFIYHPPVQLIQQDNIEKPRFIKGQLYSNDVVMDGQGALPKNTYKHEERIYDVIQELRE